MIRRTALLSALLLMSSRALAQGGHHDHSAHQPAAAKPSMAGLYGSYPMTREASGTSWQPDSAPHEGLHLHSGGWMTMIHGSISGVYDYQGSDRGDEKWFSVSMLMAQASRQLGPGTFGLRSMMSLDPTQGKEGYPLLLQTGETADGQTPLIDRQHPHDLFMELAMTYSLPLYKEGSVFGYFGLPGEPALGPPAFMHRFSGVDNPMAPISHHWIDSTHITYGVATVGTVWKSLKLEGSTFKGREPDQYRWDIESPKFDSYSGRVSFNPAPEWSFQTSWGYLNSPEQLEPEEDTHRLTASGIYNKALDWANWQTTFAWGQNSGHGHHRLNAYLLESAVAWRKVNSVFARAERADKNELFLPGDALFEETFIVYKVALGYVRDFALSKHTALGVGGVGALDLLPSRLGPSYGETTPFSFMLFVRLKLS